jgi:predicted ABC-type ATPase
VYSNTEKWLFFGYFFYNSEDIAWSDKDSSTLSGRLFARYIRQWQETGYRIKLIFLSLPHAEMAVERVRIRVAQGGHDVDESVIRRRFDKGWNNFHNIYKRLVDAWVLYDNSGESPQLIDAGENR